MASSTDVGPGTGWQERYMGGSPEAERSLFATVFPRVDAIQEHVARTQGAEVRRAFHNKGVGLSVEFQVAADLPEHLRVGFLRPGATYRGIGRFSRSQSLHGRDGDLDQRGFAFRLETDEGPQDILLSNTPTSFAPDPVMFLRVATIFARSSRLLAPVRVMRAVGIRRGIRVLLNVLNAPDRAVSFTSQRYWSRTPFQFGAAAARLFVRPTSPPRRVRTADDPDYLTTDLRIDLREHARSFELAAQLFVDERQTPIEDSNRAWLEAVARPVVLGTVTIPAQDLDGSEARDLADRIERSETFNPWNTPCLRPLGRTNRARLEAYNRSAAKRGAMETTGEVSP